MHTLRELWNASDALPAFVAVAGAAILLAALVFGVLWRRDGRLRRLCVGLAVSTCTLLIAVSGLELYFATAYVKSDGYGVTLAGLRWFGRHWHPLNSLGYRDREHDWAGEKTLLVVGDSFIAGHGVDHIDQRLSGVLAKELGEDWNVAIVAQCGWDPRQEMEALRALGKRPDWLVVSYYINDIEFAARDHGDLPPTDHLRPPPRAIRSLVEHSHVANWFYWRVVRGRFGSKYWDWLRGAYESEAVLATHMQDLQKFVDYASEVGAALDFVVWPNLDYLAESRRYTDVIVERLRARGVNVLDLGKRFAGRDGRTLVVNAMDGHPNPATHAEVAELLLARRP